MSATELINRVAELPPRERALFGRLFRALESGTGAPGPAEPAKWPDFGERLRSIYGEKVVPDSQSVIDEGRGGR